MKKFSFSLERMRSYKDRILDEEKNKLARRRQEKDVIDRKIEHLEQAFAEISARMVKAEAEGVTIFELQGFHMQLSNIRNQLEELRVQQAQAGILVERQMTVVVAASQEVRKLDKLHDRQFEIYQTEVKKAEDLRIEELISSDLIRRGAV